MTEKTNTAGGRLPEGHYQFTVTKTPEKFRTATGKIRYVWHFETLIGTELKSHRESFMVWMMGDLLRALKCKEEKKNEFEWELEEQVGKIIFADIVYEPDKNDPNKTWARMANISATEKTPEEDGVPF